MPILEWKKDGTVAIITMTNGENRHNPDYTAAILAAFDEIEKDETLSSVIIASNDSKNWSQGIDLQWLLTVFNNKDYQSIKDFMYGLNKIFKRILLYPMPVIAAINGHAFGDGAIMACTCDFRFMKSSKGYFCFPEIDINIPFLYYKVEESVYMGKRYGARELEEHHVIVKACEDDDALLRESLAYARLFTKKRAIFGEMKRRYHKHIIEVMDKEDPEYIESLKLMM
jgi:enoyl-CoA hydratase/carnithine racemase